MSELQVLIVGCGNIAGGFDEGRPAKSLPLSHAGAYIRDGRFALAACVEPDDARRKAFMAAWGVSSGFRTIQEVLTSRQQFDVVSICSPTDCHADDLGIAIQLNPKLIFCEKPVTTSVALTETFVSECNKLNIILAVNHTRRWDADVAKLRDDIQAGRWGPCRGAVGYYNKGILNNGSHMLDLLNFLLGPMDIVSVGKPVFDFFPNDPSVPVWLETSQGDSVHLVCGYAKDYAIFELHLLFAQGVLAMEDGGMFWRNRQAVESDTFKGYFMLEAGVRHSGGYANTMIRAVDNIYGAITRGDVPASTGGSALEAQRLCEQISQQAVRENNE